VRSVVLDHSREMLCTNFISIFILSASVAQGRRTQSQLPIVINTWDFDRAADAAWTVLNEQGASALDALEVGVSLCEREQCNGTVGYGGSPDEDGETTLDAMVFHGDTMDMGAVGGLRRIKNAVSVARHVLENTGHSILVGDLATKFAKGFNFKETSLSTQISKQLWKSWKARDCQPNFWQNVSPNPRTLCGPYHADNKCNKLPVHNYGPNNHDTISMAVIDNKGTVIAGTSSNGAKYKIPGRVGDAPIPGAGAYADSKVGAALATGDGDVMMRFLPSFLMVELMRQGVDPPVAAKKAISRIREYYPNFEGALIAVNKTGHFGAACNGIDYFPFSVAFGKQKSPKILYVTCL